jgi:hypothetical protein
MDFTIKANLVSLFAHIEYGSCHPQVGSTNREELGKEIKSMLELVRTMYWQSKSQSISSERMLFVHRMEMAQLYE